MPSSCEWVTPHHKCGCQSIRLAVNATHSILDHSGKKSFIIISQYSMMMTMMMDFFYLKKGDCSPIKKYKILLDLVTQYLVQSFSP